MSLRAKSISGNVNEVSPLAIVRGTPLALLESISRTAEPALMPTWIRGPRQLVPKGLAPFSKKATRSALTSSRGGSRSARGISFSSQEQQPPVAVCQGQHLGGGRVCSRAARWRKFWLLLQALCDLWLVTGILFAERGPGGGSWPLGDDVFVQPAWHDLILRKSTSRWALLSARLQSGLEVGACC